jgi:hypothetical protein
MTLGYHNAYVVIQVFYLNFSWRIYISTKESNMEKQLYVINMSQGSYDSLSVSSVAVTDNLDKAQQYVEQLNATCQSMKKKVSAFFNHELMQWQRDNPRPDIKVRGLQAVPSWPAKKKVTPEMIEKRQLIIHGNMALSRDAHKAIKDMLLKWGQDYQDFCEQWYQQNLSPEELKLVHHDHDSHWYVEEVKWLDSI